MTRKRKVKNRFVVTILGDDNSETNDYYSSLLEAKKRARVLAKRTSNHTTITIREENEQVGQQLAEYIVLDRELIDVGLLKKDIASLERQVEPYKDLQNFLTTGKGWGLNCDLYSVGEADSMETPKDVGLLKAVRGVRRDLSVNVYAVKEED